MDSRDRSKGSLPGRRSGRPIVAMVGVALVVALGWAVGITLSSPSGSVDPNISELKLLFGMRYVLAVAYPKADTMVVAGTAPDPVGQPYQTALIVGGALLLKHQWEVRLLESYYISDPEACDHETSAQLVLGGPSLMVQCLNGGSDAQSFIAVIARPPGYAWPVVLLATTCGQTRATINGRELIVRTAGLRSGAAYPGSAQPTFVFKWMNGAFWTQNPRFSRYCTAPDDYFGLGQ